MLRRVIGVAALRLGVVEQIEADRAATGQAVAVVGLAATVASLPALARLDVVAYAALLAWTYAGWIIWAEATRFFGHSLFRGHVSRWGAWRITGFALAPFALAAWPPATAAALVWVLIAGTAATGRAMRLNWWRAAICSGQGYLLFVAGLIVVTEAF